MQHQGKKELEEVLSTLNIKQKFGYSGGFKNIEKPSKNIYIAP